MNVVTFRIDGRERHGFSEVHANKLTPKLARNILEYHAGVSGATGYVHMTSYHPQTGERWLTIYRVAAKSCRRTYYDFG